MAVFIGFKATMMKALIHAPGDGFQVMKLLVLCAVDTARGGSRKAQNTKPTTFIPLLFVWHPY
jgi:hypothetical protein